MTMFAPMPPEMQEEMDRQAAENHARRERFMLLIETLSPRELGVLYEMLVCMAELKDPAEYINYVMGQASMVLRLKHNSCVCGEDHNSEILDETRAKMAAEKVESNDASDDEAAMREYNLRKDPDGRLYCQGCGLRYVSLEDRMLRAPGTDGCHGCQLKSAHG